MRPPPRTLWLLVALTGAGGCSGWSIVGVAAQKQDGGSVGDATDEPQLDASVDEPVADVRVPDGDTDEDDAASGADGPAPDAVDPLVLERDDAVNALCEHMKDYPCLTPDPKVYANCQAYWQASYNAACHSAWVSHIRCLASHPLDCNQCLCRGSLADLSAGSVCPSADLEACETQQLQTEAINGTSARCYANGTTTDQVTCVVSCERDDAGSLGEVIGCTDLNAVKSCSCWYDGHLWARSPPRFDTKTDDIVDSCHSAGQLAANGRCLDLRACCYQDRTETCTDFGECRRFCSCVGAPEQWGAASCQELAAAHDADVVDMCEYLDFDSPAPPPMPSDGGSE